MQPDSLGDKRHGESACFSGGGASRNRLCDITVNSIVKWTGFDRIVSLFLLPMKGFHTVDFFLHVNGSQKINLFPTADWARVFSHTMQISLICDKATLLFFGLRSVFLNFRTVNRASTGHAGCAEQTLPDGCTQDLWSVPSKLIRKIVFP